MADPIDPNNMDDQADQPHGVDGDVPVEQEPMEVEPPRRAASAQFVVEGDVGSEAALREAMDPANQSLGEALRLSFRVLQVVILVLIVLFFMSGFQTVGENQSGVLSRWGRIVPVDGQESLQPGLQFSGLPYPAAEFIIFDADNRSVQLNQKYWPSLQNVSLEQATERARTSDPIAVTDRAGYVLTRDGDIAHVRLDASYVVASPVDFVHQLRDAQADQVVRMALQRSLVQVAAATGLQDLVDGVEEVRLQIQEEAQRVLDAAQTGITVASVSVNDAIPPLAIRKSFGDVQSAQVEAERMIESARQQANQRLVNAAGERFYEIIDLINQYEDAMQLGEEDEAELLLADINTVLDSDEVSGEVTQIIHRARSYRAEVESTLGNEARQFASLLPAYRAYPDMVIRQRWLRAYANVLNRPDAELYFVPPGDGDVHLRLSGLQEIKELRQRMELDRKEQETRESMYGDRGPYIPWAQDMQEGPGRQLRIEGDRVAPLREPGRMSD